MPDFSEAPLLIVFASLNRYSSQVERLDDMTVAQVMAEYYDLVGAVVQRARGRMVKFIGDTALTVFEAEHADEAIGALLELKETVDRFMAQRRWDCYMVLKVHFGTVAAGLFGPGADKRYDVLGKAVNVTARLDSQGVALSVEAFRQLGPELRQRFKKHTPPITYIRQEDPHRVGAKR